MSLTHVLWERLLDLQALGGHRSNSAEHQERVQKLRQQGLAAIIKPGKHELE